MRLFETLGRSNDTKTFNVHCLRGNRVNERTNERESELDRVVKRSHHDERRALTRPEGASFERAFGSILLEKKLLFFDINIYSRQIIDELLAWPVGRRELDSSALHL